MDFNRFVIDFTEKVLYNYFIVNYCVFRKRGFYVYSF